ncbi:phage tail tube protein [Paludibaculum fermentans]|uniref:phage tail tube protein n=1 Tax=Paludibaculum fermentans TaxID=1473598 RepID=UPI003EB93AD4
MANKYAAKGVTFGYGSPLVTVASVKSISGPKLSAEQIDVTTHDSSGSYREFVQSFKDSGEVTLNLVYDPSDTTQGNSTGLLSLFNSGAVTAMAISYPMTSPVKKLTFTGIVIGYEWGNAEISSALEATVTVKVSGAVTLA